MRRLRLRPTTPPRGENEMSSNVQRPGWRNGKQRLTMPEPTLRPFPRRRNIFTTGTVTWHNPCHADGESAPACDRSGAHRLRSGSRQEVPAAIRRDLARFRETGCRLPPAPDTRRRASHPPALRSGPRTSFEGQYPLATRYNYIWPLSRAWNLLWFGNGSSSTQAAAASPIPSAAP